MKSAYPGSVRRRWLTVCPQKEMLVKTAGVRGIEVRSIDGELLHQLDSEAYWHRADISHDGRLVVATSFRPNTPDQVPVDPKVCVWDISSGHLLATIDHPDSPFSVKFGPRGKLLVTACRDSHARIWDWRANKLLVSLRHRDEVFDARFSYDGRWVFTACRSGYAQVWEVKTGLPVTPEWLVSGPAYQVLWDPNTGCSTVAGNAQGHHQFDFLPDRKDSDRLQQISTAYQLMSGQHLVERNGLPFLVTSTTDQWLGMWNELPAKPQTRQTSSDWHLWSAMRCLETEKLNDARLHLEWALEHEPANDQIVFERDRVDAFLAMRQGDKVTALRLFNDCLGSLPTHLRINRFAASWQVLNELAWEVSSRPGRELEDYQAALNLARFCVLLAPSDGSLLNTMGVAEFRCGKLSDARKTLEKSAMANRRALGGDLPHDLAFLAMTEAALGDDAEAEQYLHRAVKAAEGDRWRDDDELESIMREARAIELAAD